MSSNKRTGNTQQRQLSARTRGAKRHRSHRPNQDWSEDELTTEDQETEKSKSKRKKPNTSKKDHVDYIDSDEDDRFRNDRAVFWEAFNKRNNKLSNPLEPQLFEDFFESLRNGNHKEIHEDKQTIQMILDKRVDAIQMLDEVEKVQNRLLGKIVRAWEALLDQVFAQVPPSTFGKSSGWIVPQLGPCAIDCLRPSERCGLPIVLLHPAFANFTAIIEQPAPQDLEYVAATQLADTLCQGMSGYFHDEGARREEFNKMVGPFFSEFPKLQSVTYGSAQPDASIIDGAGETMLIVEYKNEPGNSGNVYMQASRSFDAVAQRSSINNRIQTGCSAFVLCVEGPQLLICGGFREKNRSVVEPLSNWCFLLPDRLEKREDYLSKHLYALKMSMRLLVQRLPLPATIVYCPRIYNQFENLEGTRISFTFVSPIDSHPYSLFLGTAKMTGDKEEGVVIKLVQGNYGKDAHCFAAENGFAPRLYGMASLDGAPTAYIMESLSKKDGWRHPQDIFIPSIEHFEKLEAKINRFLNLLEENDLVHGDLRPNNMFIRIQGESVELRVVDWDWAGTSGVAHYPRRLNPAANLLGLPNGPIHAMHDRITMMKHFKQLKGRHDL